jgi:hypothetical protein
MKNVIQDIIVAFIFFFLGYVAAFILPVGFIEEAVEPGVSVEVLSEETINLIADYNFEELSSMVHKEKGLTFSPYPYIQESDLNFSADEVGNLNGLEDVYTWGVQDGSGEPIQLDFTSYYNDFIYDYDYANTADAVTYNTVTSHGSMINNIEEAYPDAEYAEYFVEGRDLEFGGLDWGSLTLVFENSKLVGIVHGEWTS